MQRAWPRARPAPLGAQRRGSGSWVDAVRRSTCPRLETGGKRVAARHHGCVPGHNWEPLAPPSTLQLTFRGESKEAIGQSRRPRPGLRRAASTGTQRDRSARRYGTGRTSGHGAHGLPGFVGTNVRRGWTAACLAGDWARRPTVRSAWRTCLSRAGTAVTSTSGGADRLGLQPAGLPSSAARCPGGRPPCSPAPLSPPASIRRSIPVSWPGSRTRGRVTATTVSTGVRHLASHRGQACPFRMTRFG